ncbi:MAG TPA: ABC transporter permease [Clostridia bacterium]|nr:ABC transporter permease [Clostridia bacterium]HQA97883.1 ABC transporter permease [Clostridia bacterium]HQO55871.1 ABC transporter permease [Clostridia bacterium]
MWQVLKNNLRQLLASKGTLVVALIMPVVLFAVSLAAFGTGDGMYSWNVALVDQDHTALSQNLSEVLSQDANRVKALEEEEINEELKSGRMDLAVLVPAGFEQKVLSGEEPSLTLRSLKGQEVVGTVSVALNLYVADLLRIRDIQGLTDGQSLADSYRNLMQEGMQYREVPVSEHSGSAGMRQGSGFLFYVLSISMLQVASLILKEKQLGTLSRIRQAPVERLEYIFSVFLAGVLILLVNLLSLHALITYAFGVYTTLSMYLLWFYYGLVWLFIGIFMALIVNSSAVHGSLIPILTVITSMLGGSYWPIWLMPEFMQKIARITPQYWANDAMEILQQGQSLLGIPQHLLALTGFAALFLSLGVFALRRSRANQTFV